MKILQISPQIPLPESDGGKKSIVGITKALAARGHKIDFVAYRKHHDVKSAVKMLSEFCTPHILDVQTNNSLGGAFFNLFSNIPYNVSKFYSKKLTEFIRKYFQNNEVDIVQIHNVHMAWIIDEIRKYTEAPIVLRQENAESMIMKRFYENESNSLLKYFAKVQYKKFVKYEPNQCLKFDKCIMISELDKEVIRSYNPEIKLTSIPAGVDESLLSFKKENPIPFSIAHIGQISWLPNLDSLLWLINDILPRIKKEENRVKLFVYGAGDFSKIKIPHDVRKNVEIVGYVEDIWSALSDKQIVAVPLRIGSGIRIKVLDMLAFGQPVISTSIGKEGINIHDQVEILIADNAEEFALKILKFFQDEYPTKDMVVKGRTFIKENYLWPVIAAKFEALYTDLFKKKC